MSRTSLRAHALHPSIEALAGEVRKHFPMAATACVLDFQTRRAIPRSQLCSPTLGTPLNRRHGSPIGIGTKFMSHDMTRPNVLHPTREYG